MPARNVSRAKAILAAAMTLRRDMARLRFGAPVAHVYHPLDYAWPVHQRYILQFADGPRKVVFLGMNPGPFGMMQTGVPFGEIAAVRDWMGLSGKVAAPANAHPKKPVQGFDCPRSEVSGRRLWGLFADRYKTAPAFFKNHFVVNYCPLGFLDAGGRNLTPDKLRRPEREPMREICDAHLRGLLTLLEPEWAVAVGDYAAQCLDTVLPGIKVGIRRGKILHPSPASPAANRGWAEQATRQLESQGIWS